MSVSLTITFSGSCGYVINETAKSGRVLFPNAEHGGVSQAGGVVIPPHLAYIKTREGLFTASRPPDYTRQIGRRMLQVWLIEGWNSLPPAVRGRVLDYDDTALDGGAQLTSANERSIRWMAEMKSVCNQATLKTECVAQGSPALSQDLTAVLHLAAGQFAVEKPRKEKLHFEPAPCVAFQERQLASRARLAIDIADGADLRLGAPGGELVLTPRTDVVSCEMGNESLEEILQLDTPPVTRDHNFEIVFKLVDFKTSDRHVHVPEVSPARGKKTDCYGALFRIA